MTFETVQMLFRRYPSDALAITKEKTTVVKNFQFRPVVGRIIVAINSICDSIRIRIRFIVVRARAARNPRNRTRVGDHERLSVTPDPANWYGDGASPQVDVE